MLSIVNERRRDQTVSNEEPVMTSEKSTQSRPFREVEGDLERGWEQVKGASALSWIQARYAVSDAWHRAGRPAALEPASSTP